MVNEYNDYFSDSANPSPEQEKAADDLNKQFFANISGKPEEGPIHKEFLNGKTYDLSKTINNTKNNSQKNIDPDSEGAYINQW